MPFTPPTTVASVATTGYLAQFFFGTAGSPPTYGSALSELRSFQVNVTDVPSVPTSHLLSPLNTEEMIPGMIKPGTIEISGNFIGDAAQLALLTASKAQTIGAIKVTAAVQSSAKTYTGTGLGFITKYDLGPFENNKAIDYKATIQLTGPWTEAVA